MAGKKGQKKRIWSDEGLCCTNQLMAEVSLSPDRLIPQLQ
jgi:hypothetical protein